MTCKLLNYQNNIISGKSLLFDDREIKDKLSYLPRNAVGIALKATFFMKTLERIFGYIHNGHSIEAVAHHYWLLWVDL